MSVHIGGNLCRGCHRPALPIVRNPSILPQLDSGSGTPDSLRIGL